MLRDQEFYKYWIGSIPNFKTKKIEAILQYFGSPWEAYHASGQAMEDMIKSCREEGIRFNDGDLDIILISRDIDIIKQKIEYLKKHGIEFVTKIDSSYPDKLKHIYDPPFLLYCKGKPLDQDKKIISIVGARECSIYGKETAKYLAATLAREDIIIVSGLARGIDSFAHMGALMEEGTTYGIMGCGIDMCYPVENIKLYMDMQAKGGIISEYGPGVKPLAYHFPMRNRLISGLSDGILVIEARERSGSLITVDMGLEQGKNIYAIPGRITDKLSQGCNNLLKIGAKLVSSPQDILEDLLEYNHKQEDNQIKLTGILSEDEQSIYELIELSPKHITELVELSDIDIGRLMEHLLSLELKNMIYQPITNYFVRRRI